MKKLYSVALLALLSAAANAQQWTPPSGKGLVKFSDVRATMPHHNEEEREKEEEEARERKMHGQVVEEDENYHTQRWEWYWAQHLDDNGYIIPSARGVQEWINFKAQNKQAAARTTASASNWIFVGPKVSAGGYGGIGRINVVAFDPVDSSTIYVGCPGGGVWKSTNGGNTWTCLYSDFASLGVADIKVNPLNRNTIYVATGDGDAGDTYSLGVIKSTDGGATWHTTGLVWPLSGYYNARSLIINPADTSKILLASNTGIFKSNNAGATWTNVDGGDFRQVLFHPTDTNIVYASKVIGGVAQISRSANGGNSWTTVTSFSGTQRINLAVTPANDAIVMAIASDFNSGLKAIYKSTNEGVSYNPVFTNDASCTNNLLGYDLGLPSSACNGQGWYDLCITIDPLNANNVVIGGVNNYYSVNGGNTWVLANRWWGAEAGISTVHADKHFLGWNPLNHALYLGCDGGVYKTYAPNGRWKDISTGLGNTQFYRNAVENNASFVLGGAQDNGTKRVDGTLTDGDLTGGDGMQPLINYQDTNIFYCAYQNGSVDMTTDGGASFNSITGSLPTPGAWITPYILHPINYEFLYIGYKAVYFSNDNGASWSAISPEFSTDDDIEILAQGRTDPNYIYAVYQDYTANRSVIKYTENMGTSWGSIIQPPSRFVSDLVVDPHNPRQIYATISGYGPGKVYKYDLAAPGSWTNISTGLPDIPINCMVIDSFSGTKYIGTDAAVFYKTDSMTSWSLYNTNLPSVEIRDLNINYNTNELWAATYGRGMWKSIKRDVPPSHLAVNQNQATANAVSIAPNPCHGTCTLHTVGVAFRNATVSVRLYAADGKTALETKGTFNTSGDLQVSITNLAPGCYFAEISAGNVIARNKVMVY